MRACPRFGPFHLTRIAVAATLERFETSDQSDRRLKIAPAVLPLRVCATI